jgi:radical SAM-linked protein
MSRTPDGPPPPAAVQKLRIRFAKRGRLRFTSHRDFQRAFERALRRAGVPMAYSAGFSPHPKISYVGAAPTGTASEAEYLEIAVTAELHPGSVQVALDDALPPGLDVLEVVEGRSGSLPERIEASVWHVRLPGLSAGRVGSAVREFLASDDVPVERVVKDGRRRLNARAAVLRAEVSGDDDCAILTMVVRHLVPAVRPDDVLVGLRQVADLAPPVPPSVTRLAQGLLDEDLPADRLADPLAPDRSSAAGSAPTADGTPGTRPDLVGVPDVVGVSTATRG